MEEEIKRLKTLLEKERSYARNAANELNMADRGWYCEIEDIFIELMKKFKRIGDTLEIDNYDFAEIEIRHLTRQHQSGDPIGPTGKWCGTEVFADSIVNNDVQTFEDVRRYVDRRKEVITRLENHLIEAIMIRNNRRLKELKKKLEEQNNDKE